MRENNLCLDFWSNNPNWAAWRINRPYRWATGEITGWFVAGLGEPSYYNYGRNRVHYSGDQSITAISRRRQPRLMPIRPQRSLRAAAAAYPQDSEWMTLGVFALTQDGPATGSAPTLYLQLSVSKAAVINGLVTNTASGETQTLQGAVDKASQRAVWQMAGKQFPVMETGIYNLTQDTAAALIHFADGQTQQCLLVRLEEPKE